MTNEEFIYKIIDYYKESRFLTIDKGLHNIFRGVSHSISSKAEDLFALFVAERLSNNKLEFIVDKSFSLYRKGQKTIQFRPDLAIINDDKLTHIIDLKMDMGYKRRFHETVGFEKLEQLFRDLRSQNFDNVSYRDKNDQRDLKVSKNITDQIVVISAKNEGNELNRKDMIAEISKLDWVNIYYLTDKVHPNSYADKVKESIDIVRAEFDRLFVDIKINLP